MQIYNNLGGKNHNQIHSEKMQPKKSLHLFQVLLSQDYSSYWELSLASATYLIQSGAQSSAEVSSAQVQAGKAERLGVAESLIIAPAVIVLARLRPPLSLSDTLKLNTLS